MPRPRTNDPSNLPSTPRLAATPEREKELVSEFQRRLSFIESNYRLAQKALRTDQVWYNDSLSRLRKRYGAKRKVKAWGERIHPEIEMLVTHHARNLAAVDCREVEQKDIEKAGWIAVNSFKVEARTTGKAELSNTV